MPLERCARRHIDDLHSRIIKGVVFYDHGVRDGVFERHLLDLAAFPERKLLDRTDAGVDDELAVGRVEVVVVRGRGPIERVRNDRVPSLLPRAELLAQKVLLAIARALRRLRIAVNLPPIVAACATIVTLATPNGATFAVAIVLNARTRDKPVEPGAPVMHMGIFTPRVIFTC